MTAPSAPLPRQAALYIASGLAQLALDTAVFVASTALGMPVAAGNLAGRVSGACLGFWINGRYTFADGGQPRLRGANLRRFLVSWVVLTAASTFAVAAVADAAGLRGSWLAKPAVEAVLAVVGFVVQRHWVFRAAP